METDLEMQQALEDAQSHGTGFGMFQADGTFKRLDPIDVRIAPPRCKVCDADAGLACSKPDCPQAWMVRR